MRFRSEIRGVAEGDVERTEWSRRKRQAFRQELLLKMHMLRRQEEPEEADEEADEEAEDESGDSDLDDEDETSSISSAESSPSPTSTTFPTTALFPAPPTSVASILPSSSPPPPPLPATTAPPVSAAPSTTTDSPASINTLSPAPPDSVQASASAPVDGSAAVETTQSIISSASTSLPLAAQTTAPESSVQTGGSRINSAEREDSDDISPPDGVGSTGNARVSQVGVAMGSVAGAAVIACIILVMYKWRKRRNRLSSDHISQFGDNYQAAQTSGDPWAKSQSQILDEMFVEARAAEQGSGGYYPGGQGQVGANNFADEKNSVYSGSYHEDTGANRDLDTNQHLQPPEPFSPVSRPPTVWNGIPNSNSTSRYPSVMPHTPYTEKTADANLLSLYARSSRGLSWFYKAPHQVRQEIEKAEQRQAERRERDLAQLEAETVQIERQFSFRRAQGKADMSGGGGFAPSSKAGIGLRPPSVAQMDKRTTVSSESTWKTWQVDKREPEKEKGWLEKILEKGGLK